MINGLFGFGLNYRGERQTFAIKILNHDFMESFGPEFSLPFGLRKTTLEFSLNMVTGQQRPTQLEEANANIL